MRLIRIEFDELNCGRFNFVGICVRQITGEAAVHHRAAHHPDGA